MKNVTFDPPFLKGLYFKKSRIRETKHLLTNADSSTNTKNPASKAKFAGKRRRKKEDKKCAAIYTLYKHKFHI